MSRGFIAVLVLIGLLGFGGYLFVVQNLGRSTQVSFDLGFAAWQLANPVSIPVLVGLAFGVGLGTGLLLTLPRMARISRKARTLERQVALSGDDDAWR